MGAGLGGVDGDAIGGLVPTGHRGPDLNRIADKLKTKEKILRSILAPSEEIEDSTAPLIEHLKELRQRLIWSLVAFVIGMVICFTVWKPVFDFLSSPLCDALLERGQECQTYLLQLQDKPC